MTVAARPQRTLEAVLARHVHRGVSRRARRAAPPRTAPQRLTMADVLARHRLRRENQRLRTALIRARNETELLWRMFVDFEPMDALFWQFRQMTHEIEDALSR